jgi:diguanylate cyclase (GGDEF)-like protein
MKIGTKFLLIIVLLTVLIGITALSSVISSSNLLEYQIKDKFTAVSAYTMDKTHRLFYARYEDITMLADEPIICSRSSTPGQITRKLIEYKKHFSSSVPYASLSFFDLNRMRIADTDGTDIGIQHSFSEFWRGIAKGKDFVLDISESESLEERVFHFAHVVKDKNGVPFGVVVSRIPVEELQAIIERPLRLFKVGGTFNVDLIDKNGLLLYSTYNKDGMLKDTLPEWDLLKKAQTTGSKTGHVQSTDPQKKNEEKILIFAREESDSIFTGNDWTLIISLPKKEAMAPINELRNRLIVVIAVIGLIALGAALTLSRTITKPIVRLRNAVTKVGKGSLDIHVKSTSRDEIGQLTDLFNNMVRELKKLHEELRIAAAVDTLTGIYNRNKIDQTLELEIERAKRYKSPLSLILFDLDNFKNINDTYGHQSGDYVLKTVINVIKANIRLIDSLGRWGGEEFMLLAPETGMEKVIELAEKIRQCVELFAFEKVGTITISCGVAEFREDDTVDSLIKRADDALYRAKRKGRNLVEVGDMVNDRQFLLFDK